MTQGKQQMFNIDRSHGVIIAVVAVVLLCLGPTARAQEENEIEVPSMIVPDANSTVDAGEASQDEADCEAGTLRAYQCFKDAVELMEATNCNWALTMPWLYQCVQSQIRTCPAESVLIFDSMLREFNKTLNDVDCSKSCADQDQSLEILVYCKSLYEGYVPVVNKVNSFSSLSPDSGLCGQLRSITDCISTTVEGCSALQQLEYEEAETIGALRARAKCQQVPLQLPTTIKPLPDSIIVVDEGTAIDDMYGSGVDGETDTGDEMDGETDNGTEDGTDTDTGTDGGTNTDDEIVEEKVEEGGLALGYIVLLALGGVVAVIALIIAIVYCVRNRNTFSSEQNLKNIETFEDNPSVDTAEEVSNEYFKPSRLFYGNNIRAVHIGDF